MSSEENKLKIDFFSEHKDQEEKTYNNTIHSFKTGEIKVKDYHEFDDLEAVLEGVGRDAEVITNENGGKQSKTPMALHLVDPEFLKEWIDNELEHVPTCDHNLFKAMYNIALFMQSYDKSYLKIAMGRLASSSVDILIRIAKVLQYGAERYEPNNWRLIPQESHINHALIHILAEIMGDKQDSHIDHALCRLMMAMSTSKSPWFDYNDYVVQTGTIAEVPSDHPDFKPII